MSKLNTAAVATDPVVSFPAPAKDPVVAEAPVREPTVSEVKAPPLPNQSDFRLVIEEDEASGSFVYKTMDRRTGEVIQQFPREQLLHLKESNQYTAGSVVNARV
jgi:flagellar protein FlaG